MATGAFIQKGIEFAGRPGKTRILLVDEEARDLKLYRLVLEGQGFEVRACSSYESGVRSLNAEPFDFVLVSQGSLAFEGRVVLDRAVELDRHRAVLVVTRCIEMGCYLEAMQMGAVDYLEKPLAPKELLRLVQAHVQHQRFRMSAGVA
jgi:DNA-binding response OmpR family regulator